MCGDGVVGDFFGFYSGLCTEVGASGLAWGGSSYQFDDIVV